MLIVDLSICRSVNLLIWREKSTDRQIDRFEICRYVDKFEKNRHVVGLVQKFYVGSPLGNLKPISSPVGKKVESKPAFWRDQRPQPLRKSLPDKPPASILITSATNQREMPPFVQSLHYDPTDHPPPWRCSPPGHCRHCFYSILSHTPSSTLLSPPLPPPPPPPPPPPI